jgi:hypothetical protein
MMFESGSKRAVGLQFAEARIGHRHRRRRASSQKGHYQCIARIPANTFLGHPRQRHYAEKAVMS